LSVRPRKQFCKHRNTMDRSLVPLRALDGEIGHVKDFCFDDAKWAVR
jgi:hypothetical protein